MAFTYLGLARLKTEGETLAISLSSIRDELLPGLQGAIGRSKSEWRIDSYVEFNTDVLVIMARRGDDRKMLKIARSVIEDDRHIPMLLLRDFVEELMCGSKGSTPVTSSRTATERAMYQALAEQQAEKVVPKIEARELTKEELRERVERKLDLSEAATTDPVELINLGRWRQVMDEAFKDDNKGGHDGERTEEGGTVSNGRGNGGKDGG